MLQQLKHVQSPAASECKKSFITITIACLVQCNKTNRSNPEQMIQIIYIVTELCNLDTPTGLDCAIKRPTVVDNSNSRAAIDPTRTLSNWSYILVRRQ